MNGLKPAAFVNPPDEDRTQSGKNPAAIYRASAAPSVRHYKTSHPPVIASAANSNVKLDFRVDFSGTHRKALQASAAVVPRLKLSRVSTPTALAPLRARMLSALVKSFPREGYGILTHINGFASRE